VLVVGCGGLGSPLALYLAAAGVGTLLLADGDRVERSNLQRQILHGEADIGRPQGQLGAGLHRAAPRPDCRVTEARSSSWRAMPWTPPSPPATLVADGSDNYPTRFALNRACIRHGRPLVSAAAVRGEGQLASFYPAAGSPCYRCLYPDEGATRRCPAARAASSARWSAPWARCRRWRCSSCSRAGVTTCSASCSALDLKHWEQRRLGLARRAGLSRLRRGVP
jgi:molybdopterin/thiamine biosynthesis adenylyltransferase